MSMDIDHMFLQNLQCIWNTSNKFLLILISGVEILYEMYSPLLQSVEVLRLEKRLDEELLYLRDALPEYSTFPLDMDVEPVLEGAPVPVNPIKVK